jgi:two-component system chemotaxis sensor kinase CheA
VSNDDLPERLRATFIGELEDQLRTFNTELIALESDPSDVERIRSLFRSAHAVKGAARVAEQPVIEGACHALESLFAKVRDGDARLAAADFALLFEAFDALSDAHDRLRDGRSIEGGPLVALLPRLNRALSEPPSKDATTPASAHARQHATPPAAAGHDPREAPTPTATGARARIRETAAETGSAVDVPPAAQPAVQTEETVRIRADKLDILARQAGELRVAAGSVERQSREWLEFRDELARWAAQRAGLVRSRGRRSADGGRADAGDLDASLHRIVQRADHIARAAAGRVAMLDRVTDDVIGGVRRLRLRPISDATERLPRAVRDIAARTDKRIDLVIEGADIEVDRIVIEALREPLLHLVRNAADHGIEPPHVRTAAGKPPEGSIRLSAAVEAGRLRVTVEDDGSGVDAPAVRALLQNRGEIPPASDRDLAALLLQGGISTRARPTELSGRGVGLDLVRTSLERIRGSVRLTWRAGSGTRFTVDAPPSPSAMRALLVSAGTQLFALPAASVKRLLLVRPERVRQLQGRPVLTLGDEPVPVVSLAAVLGPPLLPRPASTTVPAVVVEAGEDTVAFTVDELAEEGEIVVRPLDEHTRVPHITGGALLATGRIALVLSPATLVPAAYRGRSAAPVVTAEAAAPRYRVLVADDSITTRTLEQSVLEAAGYDVTTAVDGRDAWDRLQAEGADVIVADVEMPGIDGFELCRRARASQRFADTPIVLVTGLDSPEDRARGLEAGADAYIAKSSFDQTTLLDTIQRLVG